MIDPECVAAAAALRIKAEPSLDIAVDELGVLALVAEDLEGLELVAVDDAHDAYRKNSGGQPTSAERRRLIGRKADKRAEQLELRYEPRLTLGALRKGWGNTSGP